MGAEVQLFLPPFRLDLQAERGPRTQTRGVAAFFSSVLYSCFVFFHVLHSSLHLLDLGSAGSVSAAGKPSSSFIPLQKTRLGLRRWTRRGSDSNLPLWKHRLEHAAASRSAPVDHACSVCVQEGTTRTVRTHFTPRGPTPVSHASRTGGKSFSFASKVPLHAALAAQRQFVGHRASTAAQRAPRSRWPF